MSLQGVMRCGLVIAALGLPACVVMPEEASLSFASSLQSDGPNLLMQNQAMSDLEGHLRSYVFQPTFDARMNHLLNLTAPGLSLDITELRRIAHELDQGAEANVIRLFGRQPSGTGPCAVEPTMATPYRTLDDMSEQGPIVWQFVAGDCADGKTNGLATVTSQDGTKTFTGQFVDGKALDGVYQDRVHNVVLVGRLAEPGERSRMAWRQEDQGKLPVYYVGGSVDGRLNGVGAYAQRRTDVDLLLAEAGHYQDGRLNGFGARHVLMSFLGDGRTWGVWLGNWQHGRAHGLAGWTNNADQLVVGTYENGTLHGVAGSYFINLGDMLGTESWFRFGGYQNGERHGSHVIARGWTGMEAQEEWSHGNLVGDDSFDIGQFLALGSGMALIGIADIPDTAKIQLGGAYVADVMGGGDGSMTTATGLAIANSIASQNVASRNVSSAAASATQASSQAGVQYESYSFTCDHGGSYTIDVPYLDAGRVSYKKAYAKAMACNEVGNMATVIRDCERVYGNKVCVEQ